MVNYRESGKRKRKFFETKEAAASEASYRNALLARNGTEGAEFSTKLRVMAQEAAEKLEPFGKTIADAVQHYVAYLKAVERSCTVEELVGELLATKEKKRQDALHDGRRRKGTSKRHLDDLRARLKKFSQKFADRIVATITKEEINQWLQSLGVGPLTQNHYRRLTIFFFNYAIKHGYATENPAAKTEREEVPTGQIGILTVSQAARLSEVATPDILPFIAIGLFAGVRRAEIERLDWSEIDFDSNLIEVTTENEKLAARRHVTLQPNLRDWLLPHRKHAGKVAPKESQLRRSLKAARLLAGIRTWPNNAARHSFASYHLAHFKDPKLTAMELGHRDPETTYAYYRELVKPKKHGLPSDYWSIWPATTDRVVQLAAHA